MSIASVFRLVERDVLERLHDSTLNVLANTGVDFKSAECREIFKQHGANVEGERVFFPAEMVNKAIETAPANFTWQARNSEHSIDVGSNQQGIHVCVNNGPVYVQDIDNGRRLGTTEDLIKLYKLSQQSNICNIVGQIPVEPSDLSGENRHLEIFRHLLTHTDKPLYGWLGKSDRLSKMFDMIKISCGSELTDDTFFEDNRIAVSINPLSPLRFDDVPCETMLTYARLRQPVMILTCAMSGVTAPVDPMGTVVQQNAEMLAGLTLIQLVSPGSVVIYSPASAIPNMRSANYITGSPASNLINIVNLQLARELYNVPNRCMAGLTDAKALDCQAGLETMQNYLMLAMSGVNMVNECFGILDSIMTVSYEKFVIDDEIMARAAEVMKGISALEDDFSESEIHKVGPGGSYLMQKSTMQQCRSFWTPALSTMESYDDWEKHGAEDMLVKANKKYKNILEGCPEMLIEDGIDQALQEYVRNA